VSATFIPRRIRPAWAIVVPGHPPGPNERLHGLQRHKRCKPLRDFVAWQCRAIGLPTPLERCHVVATLVYPDEQMRDIDNATASLKPLLDGLVVGRLIVDDGPDHLTLDVRQELGERRAVMLEIWPGGQMGAQASMSENVSLRRPCQPSPGARKARQ